MPTLDRSRWLQTLKGSGFSLHLAYFTVVELLEQVREERFSGRVVRARDHLELLLSSTEPIMLGGTELLASIGILHLEAPSKSLGFARESQGCVEGDVICEITTGVAERSRSSPARTEFMGRDG